MSMVAPHPIPPVITIDGPTASGKGTVSHLVANHLGWHVLDSGALYRLTALACLRQAVDTTQQEQVAQLARQLNVRFGQGQCVLDGENVADVLRTEQVGLLASQVAAYEPVRAALLARQRDFQQPPGLIADGRDMGTVVFPSAPLKIYLVADAQSRAERRYKQLIDKGISANLSELLADLQARDLRDTTRSIAPLKPAKDAILLDSSHLTIEETVNQVLAYWAATQN
ncbi:MAG TPA: (d)CMP kinase [Paenalcaligenes hominis]|uniref:Cytidylate kinase n=2 Tax=Paenalcaligenes hominis TaxID=643674 RepID=A0A9D2VHL3_9BURK|nr:(d)CMP kinase [Paenalcaligenes hominis]GGE61923.1 cytidylate kinase [Paenalcaligenes hominis]HJH24749.1 (d)CMP kinase [Paenalcaligenes hominis]